MTRWICFSIGNPCVCQNGPADFVGLKAVVRYVQRCQARGQWNALADQHPRVRRRLRGASAPCSNQCQLISSKRRFEEIAPQRAV